MYSNHVLMAFGGNLDNRQDTPEIWQCGIRFIPTGGSGGTGHIPDPQAFADAAASYLSDWMAVVNHGVPTSCDLRYLKVNNINPDGKYAAETTYQHDYGTPVAGGATPTIPNILCLCLSWTTAAMRGPGHTGRVYAPNYGYGPAQAGQMIALGTSVTNAVTSAGALLDVIVSAAGDLDLEVEPVVASRVSGATVPITGVRVGNIFDVQRRRKDALTEQYSAAAYPGS